jgi:hypothetical protein
LHRMSVSLRAVVQRAFAVAGMAVLILSGSAAVAGAAPHFSATGPLTTSYPGSSPSAPGPYPQVFLVRNGSPAVGLACQGLQLNLGSSTTNTVGPVGLTTSTPCTGSDGYPYTVTTSTQASVPLLYNSSTAKFYFNMNNVIWFVDGGPSNMHLTLSAPPYTLNWQNPAPPASPNSRILMTGSLTGGILGNSYWTGTFSGLWKVQAYGTGLITALN